MGGTLQPPSPADRVRGETLLPAGPLGSLQRLPGLVGEGTQRGRKEQEEHRGGERTRGSEEGRLGQREGRWRDSGERKRKEGGGENQTEVTGGGRL